VSLETWTIYLIAVLGLSLTPGPNSLLVMAHGALHGWRRTLWTIAGGAVGFATLIALSMTGIAALVAAAPSALRVMKVLGGAYLLWLGVQLWRAPPVQLRPAAPGEGERSSASLFRQGLLAAVANPKVLLFYGAFLPQFVDPSRGMGWQFVHLAATFVVVEALVEGLIAGLAFRVRAWLERSGRAFNRVCGSFFAALGVALPFSG
jgi:threonine/homoserine/homoserine lactone efflux protein